MLAHRAPPADARGARADAPRRAAARRSPSLALGLLHDQGPARAVHRDVSPPDPTPRRSHDSAFVFSTCSPPDRRGLLLLVIFELIRSRRLQERYALLWLADRQSCSSFSRSWRGGARARSPTSLGDPPLPALGALHPSPRPVHPPRAAALLHGDLPALSDQNAPRSRSGWRCSSRSLRSGRAGAPEAQPRLSAWR